MRKTKSKIIVLAFSAVFCFIAAISGLFNFGSVASVKADGEVAPFRIEQGFSIRATAPDGLRVMVTVDNKADLEGATFGTLFIPEKYYDNNLTVEKNGDEFVLGHEQIINVVTSAWNDNSYNSVIVAAKGEDGEYQSFSNAVKNMPIVAVGYYIVDGEDPVYTNIVTRSMAYVAVCNYVNEDVAPAIEEIVAIADSSLTVNGGEALVIGEEYDATFTVGGMLADTSDKVEVTYASNATDVIKVENGKIVPVKGGTATITATISGENGVPFEKSVELTVAKPVIDGTKTYVYGYKNQEKLTVKAEDFDSAIVKVTYDDAVIFDNAENTADVEILAENLPQAVENITLNVETADAVVNTSVRVVNAVIMTPADLGNMFTWADRTQYSEYSAYNVSNALTSDNGNLKLDGCPGYKGTFVLGQDIDFGENNTTAFVSGSKISTTGKCWVGLDFDGQGYAIKNIYLGSNTNDCLFGGRMAFSTVKNLSVINATVTNGDVAIFVWQMWYGSILENIFVSYKTSGPQYRSLALYTAVDGSGKIMNKSSTKETTARVRNVVVDLLSATNGAEYAVTAVTSASYPKLYVFERTYTIGSLLNVGKGGGTKNSTKPSQTSANNTGYIGGGYATGADFLADVEANANTDNAVFAGTFTDAFKLEEVGGVTVLKFFDRVVKEFEQ
ncbi:MAG: hypothetical protein IKB30_03980 [Clostridia bacterium]|nr:hypothetical protein [Clostridia bacterium]